MRKQLIGYQAQRQQVLDNTERLMEGLPSNNILLYGDRGTGKSSTVICGIAGAKDLILNALSVGSQYSVFRMGKAFIRRRNVSGADNARGGWSFKKNSGCTGG